MKQKKKRPSEAKRGGRNRSQVPNLGAATNEEEQADLE
jgi:hypothetical protein